MKNKNLINKILLLVMSFQTVLLGVAFIIQVLRIYFGNEKTFTREICGQYILEILPILVLWILLIIGSFIYFNITDFKYKNISKISNITKNTNLLRICPEIDDENIKLELNKIKKKNIIACSILLGVIVLSIIMGSCYLLNIKHFDPKGNLFDQAVQMSAHLMPWIILSFAAFIGYVFYIEFNAKMSSKILLEVIKTNGKVTKEELEKNNKYKVIIQVSILCIAVVMIIIGITNGGAEDVLQKAINICTECIGLG